MFVSRLPAERIHTGHRCIGFEQGADEAPVTFANGARVNADAVIGADGIHSVLQQHVVEPSPPLFSGSVAHRGLITAASVGWPAGQMRNWLGAGKHFLVFPVRAHELVNYVGFVTTEEQTRESWSAPGDPEELCARVRRLGPDGGGHPRAGETHLPLGPLRPRAAGDLDQRAPDAARRRRAPDAAARRAGRQPGHRGRRRGRNHPRPRNAKLRPRALQLYEQVRREQAARVQRSSRFNGALYEAAKGDLAERDRQLATQRQSRAYIWNFDAEAEAEKAAAFALRVAARSPTWQRGNP